MNCLVTGGCGFIGSNVVDKLLNNGYNVKILDNLSTGDPKNIPHNLEIINADITDYNSIKNHFHDIDVVFHLAAFPRVEPSIHDPILFNKINIDGTLSVFKASVDAKVKKIVFSSSSSIYGECGNDPVTEEKTKEPLSPYALQKLCGEEYAKLFCKLFDIDIICLRYFNVYGNRQPSVGAYVPVVGIFFEQKLNNQPLTITGDGNQTRDFVNVIDVALANVKAAESNLKGYNYFNIATGKTYKIIDIAKKISSNIVHVSKRTEPEKTLADISKAKKLLNWEPTIDLYEWIEKNLP